MPLYFLGNFGICAISQIMTDKNVKNKFREYCLQFYQEIRNPFSDKKHSINIGNLELAVDMLENIFEMETQEEVFQGLSSKFYSAFNDYLELPRTEIGKLCNNVDRLAELLEPFLKKVTFELFPKECIKKHVGEKKVSIFLWKTSNYADILEQLGIIDKKKLQKKGEAYWKNQNPSLALLRKSFTSRQKGTHESRIHTLGELEQIAYSVTESFIVICLSLLKKKRIQEKLQDIIKKRRAIYLLKERTNSHPITKTLLSFKEHLLIYSYRETIFPDIEERKFLFLNYLAGKGPCFYWLKEDGRLLLKWGNEFFENPPNEVIKRNATRFLLENSIEISLPRICEIFSDYEDKEELAEYTSKIADESNRPLLLKLCEDKREEVARVAKQKVVKMFPRIDSTLEKLVRTTSQQRRKLFIDIMRNFVRKDKLEEYRKFSSLENNSRKLIYIYCLGEVGLLQDLKLLTEWVKEQRRNKILREACWYAILRIANRLGDSERVWKIIDKREELIKISAISALTRKGIGPYFRNLFTDNLIEEYSISSLILEIARKSDKEHIKNYLKKVRLDYDARDLMLALCKMGDLDDFDFIFQLLGECNYHIEFHNHVRVANKLAQICNRRRLEFLKKAIESKEFWTYVHPEEKRDLDNPLPVRDTQNMPLIRRLIAASFLRIAGRKEIDLITKLLSHNYGWIAGKAAIKLSAKGNVDDLNFLVEKIQEIDEEKLEKLIDNPLLTAIRLLDKKIYS